MSYVSEQLELLKKKNPGEPEFIQAATEVLTSMGPPRISLKLRAPG